MDRRAFIGAVAAFLGTAPRAATAQLAKSHRIGFLGNGSPTTLSSQFEELITKRLQLLKECVPNLSRVALLRQSGLPTPVLTAAESAARSLGLTARTLNVHEPAEFENAFKVARSERAGAILVLPPPYFEVQRIRLIELAARHGLPACY